MTAGEVEAAFRAEVADVFAQLLLIAGHFEVDLLKEVDEKWLVWKPPAT